MINMAQSDLECSQSILASRDTLPQVPPPPLLTPPPSLPPPSSSSSSLAYESSERTKSMGKLARKKKNSLLSSLPILN